MRRVKEDSGIIESNAIVTKNGGICIVYNEAAQYFLPLNYSGTHNVLPSITASPFPQLPHVPEAMETPRFGLVAAADNEPAAEYILYKLIMSRRRLPSRLYRRVGFMVVFTNLLGGFGFDMFGRGSLWRRRRRRKRVRLCNAPSRSSPLSIFAYLIKQVLHRYNRRANV